MNPGYPVLACRTTNESRISSLACRTTNESRISSLGCRTTNESRISSLGCRTGCELQYVQDRFRNDWGGLNFRTFSKRLEVRIGQETILISLTIAGVCSGVLNICTAHSALQLQPSYSA